MNDKWLQLQKKGSAKEKRQASEKEMSSQWYSKEWGKTSPCLHKQFGVYVTILTTNVCLPFSFIF